MARGSVRPRPSTDGKRTVYRAKWETRGPDGKRQHHSKTFRTRKEADAHLIDMQKEVNEGTFVDASKETLEAYLARWLQAMAPTWAESTLRARESVVRCRIVPGLGQTQLAKLDALMVQSFYAGLNKTYAPGTVRATHSVLDAALARAVRWRLIARNPADDALLPSSPRPTAHVWSSAECAVFLVAAEKEKHRFTALWRLALDSGMRIGELLALSWRDIALDRDEPTVSVRRTLTHDKEGNLKLGDVPKTKAGRRSIVIGPDTVLALRTYRVQQTERRLLLGPRWQDLGLVFDQGRGGLLDPHVVGKSLGRFLDRNPELPRISMHGMRHTMATLALEGGVNPKVVQERLGHASVQMTLDRYSHVTLSMQADAAQVISDLLRGEARPKRGQSAS